MLLVLLQKSIHYKYTLTPLRQQRIHSLALSVAHWIPLLLFIGVALALQLLSALHDQIDLDLSVISKQ
jgi:hypothetical protein